MLILTRRPGETLIIELHTGERIEVTVLGIKGNGARFRRGGRTQLPSLPVDDPLTSDQKGVYSA